MNTIKSNLINLLVNLPGIEEPNSRPAYIEDLVAPDIRLKIYWQGSIYDFVSNFVKFLAKHRKYLLGFLDELANSDRFGIERPRVARQLHQEIAFLSPQEWFRVFGVSDWTEWAALPDCPYRGLQAFQPEHKDLFFGRQKFVDRLVKEVDVKQLVAVIGASGSGKSSVVFAGLIPQLPKNWQYVSFRPGNSPFDALAGALPLNLRGALGIQEFAGQLQQSHDALRKYIAPMQETLVLVADQFEELYTLCSDVETRKRFLDCLLEAAYNAPRFKLLLTMRGDFYGDATDYSPFADALQNACTNLSRMEPHELQEAIARPAESRGVSLEVGLVERILHDISKKWDEEGNNGNSKAPADKLPLLEFALKQLWEEAAKKKYPELTHEAYDRIGGIELALGKYAENIYEDLLQGEQEKERYQVKQIQHVFIQLVQPREKEDNQDTRRLATRQEIGEENWDLVLRLNREDVRLVVIGRDDVVETETVEVVHEVLISGWSRLIGWMNANRDFRTWQERLRGALRQWESSGKDQGALLRGVPLKEAKGWLLKREEDISSLEQGFIRESVRWSNLTILLLTFGLLIGLGLVSAAAIGWWNNDVKNKNAEIEARITTLENLADTSLEQQLNAIKHGKKVRDFPQADLNNRVRAANLLQQMFSVQQWKERNTLQGHQGWVNYLNLSPDGNLIASASFDRTVRLWKADGTAVATLEGHQERLTHVSFSPDGNLIASASFDKTVRLWKPDGTPIATLEGHERPVNHLSFSPDGNLIASASADDTVRLWKPDGTPIAALEGHQDWVRYVSFSPDGSLIASASFDKTVRLWKPDGTPIAALEGHQADVKHVSFSPDGSLIASASVDNTVRLWKPDGTPIAALEGHQVDVKHVSFSPDSNLIAFASNDNTIRLWKSDGTPAATLKGHQSWVNYVSFSPDGSLIASASRDETVRLWKPDGTLVATLEGHQSWVRYVSFSPDGNLIASASSDNTIRLWKPDSKPFATLERDQDVVRHVSFSPDGNLITFASGDNTVRLWKPDGTAITALEEHQGPVSHVSFSPNGNLIASASFDKTVRLWQADGTPVATLEGHQDIVRHVSFSPNGNLIASASFDRTVRLWKADGTAITALEEHQGPVSHVSFSPNGNLIASASFDKTVRLWQADGTPVATLEGHQDIVRHVSFSPNGNLIASASFDRTVRLWKPDGAPVDTLEEHQGPVSHVSFSPDGSFIASASFDNTIRLWKADGTPVATLEGHQSEINNVSFSPDGNLIASASYDKTVRLWELDGTPVTTLEGHHNEFNHVSFSPDGNLIASVSVDQTVRLWNLDLDSLLIQGCDWVRDHLNTLPDNHKHKNLCNNIK
ncbi:MAG: hypothetical protein F6K18_20550 [Okeania sp. SIO2C2]|uniref:WD40 repeat domain-containing protein n=1 Tax=Okeania sp. SIO2C2 TaxID=2607787 RepID=UPI0013BCF117|nr:hypothetical protein [Okeania sp. SIO2C2]NEP89028.1 hypothetical protein [Okeania sp. SIO2C2]